MAVCGLSVVLPVYQEAKVLEANLGATISHLEGLADLGDFELVCVDDGSTDDSLAILRRMQERDPRIRVEVHGTNRGKGAAVRTGMLAARGEVALFMDADLSTPLEELGPLLAALAGGASVVIGNRRAADSKIMRRQSRVREVLGRGFTGLTRFLLVPGIHDFTCGFKGFRGDVARQVFERSRSNGWAFDAELVVIAHGLGHEIVQIPVSWRHEDGSKVRVLSAVFASLFELFQIRWNRARGLYH